VATFIVGAVLASTASVTGAVGPGLRSPALGHANCFTTVPSVIGKSVRAAVAELDAAELTSLVHPLLATGVVRRESPAAGARVLRGSRVSIWAGEPSVPATTTVVAPTSTTTVHGANAHRRH
jgi:hypothetical protein